jgi:hypothetical protein
MEDSITDIPEEGDIIKIAKERFKRAEEFYSASRVLSVADTKFAMGDSDNGYQWPEEIRKQRQLDKRVCLTVNLTAQHCGQVINAIRQQRPSCRVLPVDDYADKKTAEILAGLIRNIQTNSAADDAHDLAAEHMLYGGEGFWRVTTEFETPQSFNQVIKIKACADPQLVYIDPDAKELDRSDARWGFVFEDINKDVFKSEHPDIDPADWEESSDSWVKDETFRRAEYFWCEFAKDTALLLEDGSTCLLGKLPDHVTREDMELVNGVGERVRIVKERDTERRTWKWCKLVGRHPDPIDQTDWVGEYLPIIAITGKEINVNGEIIRKGLVRDLKDPARMVNFSYSEATQTLALQNKIPYIGAAAAFEGWEDVWGGANLENRAFLPFNHVDEEGNPIPAPQRQQPAVMPAAQVQMLQLSTDEMRGASGQQNSNFGIKSEASSGIGIQRLKQQGEVATFHFPDNLARGLRYEAKVLIDLIQKIYDTKRVVRILGLDGKQQQATLDPQHQSSYTEHDIGEADIQKIFNPTLGQYDVVIDTGPSFQTQRQEGAAALNELASRNPALMQVAGDLIMQAQDFPMAQQLADRLQKTLPPGLQDQKGGAEAQAAQATQQLQQAQQHLQMMQQQMAEMQQKLQVAESGQAKSQAEIQAKMQMAQMDAQLQDSKLQRDIESKKQAAMAEAELKREQALLDAHIRAEEYKQEQAFQHEKALLDAHMALEKAKLDNETKEDIAELQAYVEMQKVGKDNPALTADVNSDLQEEKPLPKILKRKISMKAPSGGMYEGTIEDM